jgi:hypothetical protein
MKISLPLNDKNTFAVPGLHLVHGNGRRGQHKHKFSESTATVSITSAGTLTSLLNVAQGNLVTNRDGDVGEYESFFFNFSVDAANADIFTRSRIILLQWHPNTVLVVPTIATILQTVTPYSFYNFAESDQFTIVKDFMISSCGLATAPTSSSSMFVGGQIDISAIKKRIQWAPAVNSGSNQLYILYISDSVIAPFPNLVYNSHIDFTDRVD